MQRRDASEDGDAGASTLLFRLCYLAPVVIPNPFFIDELKSLILRFLSPNRNIFPTNRVFLPCTSGGLGLQEPGNLIKNLALKFAFRSSKSNQAWSAELKSFFPNNNICVASFRNHIKPRAPACTGRFIELLEDF